MMSWGIDVAGWLWMGAWLAALFAMVALIVRGTGRQVVDDSLAILRARFARGEINQEEFERSRAALLEGLGEGRKETS